MKKVSVIFLSFLMFTRLFAAQGVQWGQTSLRTVSTKWFDIIYPKDSSAVAKKLYDNVDSIYEEVAELYGMEPEVRMPVVITPEVEIYNAYWSSGYYNHIVIYDTAISDNMAVFSDDLLSTFRHEVTHAFTYNLKRGIWKALSKVIGDAFTASGFCVTQGWAEGATLTSESYNGEGRLNDEYSKQMIRQAKIENKFPSYSDIQGEADHLPSGSYYYFNGAFNEYLQKSYGMEKYAQLWVKMVNLQTLSPAGAFKKIYGFKLRDAWNDFMENYYVPEVAANPVKAGLVQDFFTGSTRDYSKDNFRGSLYSSLSSSSKGLFYIDETTDSLNFVSTNQLQNKKIKPKRLLTLNNLIEAKASSDGRYVALSYYDINKANIKIRPAVFDVENKKLHKIKETGIKSVSIMKNDDDYYVVGLKFRSQNKQVQIFKIDFYRDRINSFSKTAEIKLPENTAALDFTDLQNGTFAFLLRTRLNYDVCLAALDGTLLSTAALPAQKITIRNMSYSPQSRELLFSYTTPDQMPQLGKLSLPYQNNSQVTASFWNQNLSGGVYSPVIYNSKLYYIGNFYLQNRILTKSVEEISFNQINTDFVPLALEQPAIVTEDELPYTKYKGSKYLFKGLFIPISTVTSVSFDPINYGSMVLPWGITFIRSNPWDSYKTSFSAGYGFMSNSFGVDWQLISGTETSLFNYGLETSFEFDKDGFKQTTEYLTLGSGFYTGNHSSLTLNNSSIFHYGRSGLSPLSIFSIIFSNLTDSLESVNMNTNYIYGLNQTQLTYSNIIRTGPGHSEKSGFSATTMLAYQYNKQLGESAQLFRNGWDIGFAARFYVPKLLPVKNKQGIITNLPTKISANLFLIPENEEGLSLLLTDTPFPTFTLASTGFETVLFQKDIQKTIKIFPLLFASDITLSLSYMAGVSCTQEAPYSDNWKIAKMGKYIEMMKNGSLSVVQVPCLKLSFGLTPTTGVLADSQYKTFIYLKAGCIIKENRSVPVGTLATSLSF